MPAVHLQVPRVALPLRVTSRSCSRSRSSSTSTVRLRPRKSGWRRGGVHLREPRHSDTMPLQAYRASSARTRGLPFGEMTRCTSTKLRSAATEAVHRRLHRVLPRTRLAREAGGFRESQKLQAYGYEALPTRSTDRTGWCRRKWHVAAERPRDGEADRAALRSGLFGPWERAVEIDLPPAVEPGAPPRQHRLVRSSPTSWCWSGRRTGTSRTTTGPRRIRTSSRNAVLVPEERPERLQQELRRDVKEYLLQDGNTLEATQTMLESR